MINANVDAVGISLPHTCNQKEVKFAISAHLKVSLSTSIVQADMVHSL